MTTVSLSPHAGLSPESIALLKERARALAGAKQQDEGASHLIVQEDTYLAFEIMQFKCAVPLRVVREVVTLSRMTIVPRMPAHVVGLTRVRGMALALVDVRRFWYDTIVGHADTDLGLMVEVGDVEFGILCTEVTGLIEVPPSGIEQLPENYPANVSGCLYGLYDHEVMLIDPEALIQQPRFRVAMRAGDGQSTGALS